LRSRQTKTAALGVVDCELYTLRQVWDEEQVSEVARVERTLAARLMYDPAFAMPWLKAAVQTGLLAQLKPPELEPDEEARSTGMALEGVHEDAATWRGASTARYNRLERCMLGD